MRRAVLLFPCVMWLLAAPAAADTIDFEGLSDLEAVTTQFPDMGFSNALALTSGFLGGTLNEIETPPHSGVTVITDDGAAMSITFLTPVGQFSGFFTYNAALTITAFDAADSVLGSVNSLFTNNQFLSGVAGSSTNELLTLAFSQGISRVVIAGSPSGNSFTLDDVTAGPVPEPASLTLFFIAAMVLLGFRRSLGKT